MVPDAAIVGSVPMRRIFLAILLAFAFTGSVATAHATCKDSTCQQKPSAKKKAVNKAPTRGPWKNSKGEFLGYDTVPGTVTVECHGIKYRFVPVTGTANGTYNGAPLKCN